MTYKIQKAKIEHVKAIYALANSYFYQRLGSSELAGGFLVSEFTEDDYREFVDTTDLFFVLLEQDEVVGFLLAFRDTDSLLKNSLTIQEIHNRDRRRIILIKQICVARKASGKGYGTRLYHHLFKQVVGMPVYAAIVLRPYNKISILFHEKMGFKKCFEYLEKDGLPRGVWVRD